MEILKLPTLLEFMQAGKLDSIPEYQKAMLDMLDKGTGIIKLDRHGRLRHIPIEATKIPIPHEGN